MRDGSQSDTAIIASRQISMGRLPRSRAATDGGMTTGTAVSGTPDLVGKRSTFVGVFPHEESNQLSTQ